MRNLDVLLVNTMNIFSFICVQKAYELRHLDVRNSWQQDAEMAYVPYRCGMVPSGLEEACVPAANVQVVRTWRKRSDLDLI